MRKSLIRLMALLLVIVPLLGVWANDSSAASSRVAVIKELKGTVKVKKAGGSKEFTAFAKMSLNEGDVLSVSSGGSAVLQFANGTSEDDKMTVAANTKLSFSKLSNRKGTTTKVSMWSGSAWVDVKSIANSADEFTLETPTAVMGVRGTHFIATVDPLSGSTQLSVAAGVVSMLPPISSIGAIQPLPQLIYPSQTILALPNLTGLPTIVPAPINPTILVNQAGAALIEAMLRSSIEIQNENQRLMERYINEQTIQLSDLDRIKGNIDNLVSVIANQAIKSSTINSIILGNIQAELLRTTGKQLDLQVKELQLSDEEKKKQELLLLKDKIAKEEAEKKKKDEEKARDKELKDKLKKKLDDQKKAVEEELKKKKDKAFKDYESKLDELEKARFLKNKGEREAELSSSTTSQTSSGYVPPVTSYVPPIQSVTVFYYDYDESEGTPVPVFDTISVTSSTYEYQLSEDAYDVHLEIGKLVSGPWATGDVKVTANGEPLEYNGESYYVDLYESYEDRLTITIDVKPENELATSANSGRFTLILKRPPIPPLDVSFSASTDREANLSWYRAGWDTFNAITSQVASTITFTTMFDPEIYEYAELTCIDCDGVDTNDETLTLSGLQPGKKYEIRLAYYKEFEEFPDYSLDFYLYNGRGNPNWDLAFQESLSFRENFTEGSPVEFVKNNNGVLVANVSDTANRLQLTKSESGIFNGEAEILGFLDEDNWMYERAIDWYYGGCESDYCGHLETGDNYYTMYVRDIDGSIHTYKLNIRKQEPQPPMLEFYSVFGNIDDNDENDLRLTARYAGGVTWVVYAPQNLVSLDLNVNSYYISLEGHNDAGAVLAPTDYVNIYSLTNLAPNAVNEINLDVTDTYSDAHFVEKLIVYNGVSALDVSGYELSGIEGLDPDGYGDVLTYEHNGPFIFNPSAPSGKDLVGIYDEDGNALTKEEGMYHLYPRYSLSGTAFYVVVKDGTYIVPTKIVIYPLL